MRSYRKQSIISNMSRSGHLEGNDTYAVINISTNVDHINLEFDQFNFIILEMIRTILILVKYHSKTERIL